MMIARRSADCGLLAINPCSHQQMPLKSASGTSAAIVRGSEIDGRNHRGREVGESDKWHLDRTAGSRERFTNARRITSVDSD
jgi:hypothetical protein